MDSINKFTFIYIFNFVFKYNIDAFWIKFGNNSLALPILTVGIMIQAIFGLGSPSLTMRVSKI